MSDPRRVTLVLDASAVAAFVRGSLDVGEVLIQVAEDDALAVIPLASLAEAASTIAEDGLLDFLLSRHAVVVHGGDPEAWRALTHALRLTGRFEAASAALLAVDHQAALITRRPEWYEQINRGGLILSIDD